MFETKLITSTSASNLESDIKRFLKEKNPEQFSISCFIDEKNCSSHHYTAIIAYKI